MKISEAFSKHTNEYLIPKNMSISTIQHYAKTKRSIIFKIGDKNIADIETQDIIDWQRTLMKTRGVNTVRQYLECLKIVLRYATQQGYKCYNYSLILIPKRETKSMCWCTAKEVAKMIDNSTNLRSKLVISLLYSSGIRLSELISLNRGQIVGNKFTVIGKGNKERLCFIDSRTRALLNLYDKKRDDSCPALIVSYKLKSRLTPSNVQFIVKNAARRAGINKHVTPHTLRHSFATDLVEHRADLRTVQELLGHSFLSTTQIYTHITDPYRYEQYKKCHTY